MILSKYNNKLVRITDIFGDVFEGICIYNDKEYTYHEFGKNEESLQLPSMLFYKSIIKKVEVIDNFSSPHGKLEEMVVEDGIDMIEEVFYCEEDEHIYRLLLCLEDHLNDIDYSNELVKLLEMLLKYNENEKVKREAKKLFDMIDSI